MSVLIVEDSRPCQKLFRDLLDAYGIETRQTGNGLEAMQMIQEEPPELILMDVELPDSSGIALTRWVKTEDDYAEIPVIIVTAGDTADGERLARAAGCDDYLAKPISLLPFITAVKKFIQPVYHA
jgi:two-component system cell cycle response regulator DivK